MTGHASESKDRRIECTVCYFEEEFDHEPCGIAWCSCPCNTSNEES